MTTTNLADFGYRELDMAADLLKAYANTYKGDLKFFTDEGIQLMMNQNSGNVFLTDADFNVVMEVDGEVKEFFSSPYNGVEGFLDDLISEEYATMHEEDKIWLRQIAEAYGRRNELFINSELKEWHDNEFFTENGEYGYTIERSPNTGREPKDDVSYQLTIIMDETILRTFDFYNSEEDAKADVALLEELGLVIEEM
jgi:hypothetical protein